MPAVSLKIPSDWATPPLGQKSASNGCRMPPMAVDQAFRDGAESTLMPRSAAPASVNCFNARLKLLVWLLQPPVKARGNVCSTTHLSPLNWPSETSSPVVASEGKIRGLGTDFDHGFLPFLLNEAYIQRQTEPKSFLPFPTAPIRLGMPPVGG